MDTSCHTYMNRVSETWVIMSRIHDSCLRVTPPRPLILWDLSCMFDMTYSCVTGLTYMCDMTNSCVTWLFTLWHDSFMCYMTHSFVTWVIHLWHDSFMCDMTLLCVTHPLSLSPTPAHIYIYIHIYIDVCIFSPPNSPQPVILNQIWP